MKDTLIKNIESAYKSLFKDNPVLIDSPGRINIIGEHTDYNEGFVLPAAIDKGIVAAIGKSDSDFCSVLAYDYNEKHEFLTDDIQPIPNGNWKNYVIGVVAEIQKKSIKVPPFNLVFGGDIPRGGGLSSSAALENSIVFGLNELFGLGMSKEEMILISQRAEHYYVGVRCGIMDQYSSMFGKEDHALLLDCRTQIAKPIQIDFQDYELVLINTNVSHKLVDAEYNNRREVCEKVASLLDIKSLRDATRELLNTVKSQLSEDEYQKALYVIEENDRVLKAAKMIEQNDLEALGNLLFEAHQGVRYQFKVSCKELDFLVDKAKGNPNVIGARMMGGGFGGCTINLVKKEAVKHYTQEISEAYVKAFNKACSIYFVNLSEGTHVINGK
ncbi:galactokinase [Gaetbulibacter sp. M235]|uniref:galactokinase n=1 Tax=Gaetbulibacter sp. M235 TaxID=3126510 RepID=UPI00374EFB52